MIIAFTISIEVSYPQNRLLHSITKTTRIVCFCILCYCNYQCPVEMPGHFCFKSASCCNTAHCSPLARWVEIGIDGERWGVIMGYNGLQCFQ